MSYPDSLIRQILTDSQVIAMVGASTKSNRPSFGVMRYLLDKGHIVYPVNPTCVGDSIHGQSVLSSLDEVPEPIDMVDIFRRSELAGDAVDDAISVGAKSVWMQLGVIDNAAGNGGRAERHYGPVPRNRVPQVGNGLGRQ